MTYRALNPLDSAFVTLEVPGAPLHIGVVMELQVPDDGVDSATRFEIMKSNVAARLHEIPVLTKRIIRTPLDLAWPVAVDDGTFSIDNHVIRRSVASPGGTREFEDLVSRVMSRELAPDRPLWEMNYVEGLENNRVGIVFKVHHALADGVSGAMTFAGLFDLSPEVRDPMPLPEVVTYEAPPSPLELISHTLGELARRPGALIDVLGAVVDRVANMVDNATEALDGGRRGTGQPSILEAKRTSINGTPSHTKRFTRLELPLAEVKRAAKLRGGSVTDFVMAATSGGLRRLFAERGEELGADLVGFVPINVRRAGAEGEMGNQISAMLLRLGTTESDPEARFAKIRDASGTVADAQKELNARLLMNLASAAGPTLAAAAGRTLSALELFEHLPPVANLTISSVPGPPIPLWLSGHRVLRAAPLGPLMAGLALNVTVLSYCDTLEFGLLSCVRRLPELPALRDWIEQEARYYLDTDPADSGSPQ